MICPKCNKDLIVDDEDYQFKGCFDQWLICKTPNCPIHGFRKVRYNKCILEELSEYDENTDESKIIYSCNPSKMDGSEFGGNDENL